MNHAGPITRCQDGALNKQIAERLQRHDLLTTDQPLNELDPVGDAPILHNPHQHNEQDAELSRRDSDRVRIVKRLATGGPTLLRKTIVSECVKGQKVSQCENFSNADADYRFVARFDNRLAENSPPLVEKRKTAGHIELDVTPQCLDLISECITQTQSVTGHNDKQMAKLALENSQSLTESQKHLLEDSLQSYVNSINNYQLLFDVYSYERGDANAKRMKKPYKTRFNDRGRIAKEFARFSSALEHKFRTAENAVMVTLTTDPGTLEDDSRPDPRSLWSTISTINKNWNRLKSWLERESDTIRDTRLEDTPAWRPELDSSNYTWFPDGEPTGGPPDGPVTGRPMMKLDYLKVLEFTESGYPHLHVLVFDCPTRDSDGMPWLVDKRELSAQWKGYEQGQIVDTWPLVYRSDLEAIGDFGYEITRDPQGNKQKTPKQEGFVDWYEYGDHNHDDNWIEKQKNSHDYLNLDKDEHETKATAGAYLGKYLSATFGGLLESAGHDTEEYQFSDKTARWKLACYWATDRRLWSCSRELEQAIQRDRPEPLPPAPRQAVRDSVLGTLERELRSAVPEKGEREREKHARRRYLRKLLEHPYVEATLPEPRGTGYRVDFLGAYPYWDMPTADISAPNLSVDAELGPRPDTPDLASTGDRPPPIKEAWS